MRQDAKRNSLLGLAGLVLLLCLLTAWLERKPGLTVSRFRMLEAEAAPVPGFRVDVNSAEAEALEQLPGIGPTLAQRIIEHREREGLFDSPDDLRAVHGLGPKKVAAIEKLIVLD